MSTLGLCIWFVLISLSISSISGQHLYTNLEENVIYRWWDFGSQETKYFKIYAANHTEKLSVYVTDLRSAHADGHGASLNTYDYLPYTNVTFYDVTPPSIGQGYLSIVATFSEAIKLVSGVPTHVILNRNDEFALFQFETSSNDEILTVSLTPFEGKPIAYISNSTIPIADDASTFQHTIYSHINLEENNTNKYYILTRNAMNSVTSRFYITASTDHTHILLQSGVPRQDDIGYESNRYYYFNVTEANCTLGILLTVIQGSPDLFVSVNDEYPNANNHDLRAQTFGSDYIIMNNASIDLYYIGVHATAYSYTNAKYTISSILRCQHGKHFTYLMDGVSQMNVLKAKEWALYRFEFNFNHTISEILIQINPSTGDPDLYLDIDITNVSNPKRWRYKSVQFGADHIRLSSNDYVSICQQDTLDTFCTINVAVLAYSSTIYTIMASSSVSHTSLQNGKPNTGYISSQSPYTYYQFDLDDSHYLLWNNNITISITPFVSTTGDAIHTMFYVDGGTQAWPNADNGYTYQSTDGAHPYAILPGNEIIAQRWTELYIGVTCNENITFTIVVTIGTEIQLQDGQMQLGHVSISHPMYYEFIINNADNEMIEIIASSLHGSINVFVSLNGRIPDPHNATTYDFMNNQSGVSVKRISVNNTQHHTQCIHMLCRYYITVSTDDWNNDEAEYSITVATDNAVIPLFDGQPISSDREAHEMDYFSIRIDYAYKNEPALLIEVTPIIGNVNLYVSDDENNHRPNTTYYSFKSENSGSATDSVTIDVAQQGVYYIGVYAVDQRSTFVITATLSNALHPGFIRLLSGIPQQGAINSLHRTGRFYQIYVPQRATLLKIHVAHSMFPISAYVTRNISQDRPPSSGNNLFEFESGTLTIPNPKQGSYYIGIYSQILSYYGITATLSNDILFLQDGQSISGQVSARAYDYYQIQIHDMTKDFTVSLTSFSGDPDLYISLNDDTGSIRPTRAQTGHLWSSTSFGSDLITISHNDPKSCNASATTDTQCTYIIGVYGYRNSLYSITATTEQTIELQDGVPIRGELARYQWHYYTFQVSNEPLMLVVGVTFISGQNDLFIDLNREPTESSYLYSSDSMNQDKNIQIEHTSCPNNDDVCAYFIGIKGVTESQYSVYYYASNTETEFLIEDSIPCTRSMNAQQFVFFKYNIVENLKDVTFALTPISGTPQCFISSVNERPIATNYEYAITEGANTVKIANVANNTVYHITVFSTTESTFTLSAVGEHYNRSEDATGIRLIEGQILFGSTEDWAYYSFSPSLTSNKDIIISVYALSGDPDIFCNLNTYPTLHRYLYAADLDGPETLTIPHINGTYLCGIHADNDAMTEFYIIAYHSQSIVTLIDDIPVIGELNTKNNVNYYHFIVGDDIDTNGDDDGGVVSLIFTPIYASECSIFVSWDVYHPNETSHQYAINNSIKDNGLNGIDFKIPKHELLISTDWYMTIKPAIGSQFGGTSALYTLLLSYDNVTTLQQGLPQNGQISREQVSYYIWNIDLSDKETEEALFVSLSLLSGDCTVYISRNPLIINSCNTGIGCPKGLFDFHHACSDKSPLIITKEDDYYISAVGTYYISVCNTQIDRDDTDTVDTYYNIIAYTSYTILYLSNGIPSWDAIQLNQYKYYSLLCNDDHIKSLDIVITPKNDADNLPFILQGIISTTRSRPTHDGGDDDGEYATQWVEGNGAVFSISKENQRFISSSQYFISLYASENPNYQQRKSKEHMIYTISAVASIDNSTEYRVLMNNMQQMAIIHTGNDGNRYYSFNSEFESNQSITFTLQVAQGEISLYITTNKQLQIPSSQVYQYKLENVKQLDNLTIVNACSDCSYLMVIINNDEEADSIYSIRAQVSVNIDHQSSVPSNSNKGNPVLGAVIAVVVSIIIIALSLIGWRNYRKNQRLKHELDIAELQLNMNGNKTLRQRREELETTTNKPARPWNEKQKTKNKNKKKYRGLSNHDNADAYDDAVLLDDNNSMNDKDGDALGGNDAMGILINGVSDNSSQSDVDAPLVTAAIQ